MPAEAALQSTLTRFLPSAGILDALNIQKAHIVGHDWGSALGWVFAGFYPERTIQLVAISVGHPAGYLKGEHRGEQKQKSWCAVECICIIAHLLCQRGQRNYSSASLFHIASSQSFSWLNFLNTAAAVLRYAVHCSQLVDCAETCLHAWLTAASMSTGV